MQGLTTTAVQPPAQHSRVKGIPHGLKPKSVKSYYVEWERYLRFVKRRGASRIPGKDAPWDLALLSDYMEWRAKTCKPSTLESCFSILAHFGALFGFLLPNSRDDDDSLSYRRLKNIKKQLSIDHVQRSGGAELPSRCTPLGHRDVSLLLSAFGVTSRATFRALPRRHAHHLFCSVVQHAQGMRYGHFIYRAYKTCNFQRDIHDGSFNLPTDWHRYEGRRNFCLRFRSFPDLKCFSYQLRNSEGAVVDTIAAATLMSWHFEMLAEAGETQVFAPTPGATVSRKERTAWLREALLAALPEDELAARRLVDDVTPHSFRPGLAGDLRREGMRLEEIALECRWSGLRNARMYSSRPSLSTARICANFRIIDTRKRESKQ